MEPVESLRADVGPVGMGIPQVDPADRDSLFRAMAE